MGLSCPGIHWLKSTLSDSIMVLAVARAMRSCRVSLSVKLDLRSQPAAVVLSVWLRRQDRGGTLLWATSVAIAT